MPASEENAGGGQNSIVCDPPDVLHVGPKARIECKWVFRRRKKKYADILLRVFGQKYILNFALQKVPIEPIYTRSFPSQTISIQLAKPRPQLYAPWPDQRCEACV